MAKTQIRNNEDFYFIIDNGIKTDTVSTVESQCGSIKLFISGTIYNQTEEELISGFLSKDVDYVNELRGCFVIFLIKDSIFYILTDRVNSKKSFYTNFNNSWHISNNINLLPKQMSELDINGLACYLANGVMYNNLTLFKNITIAERASIISFPDLEIKIKPYWIYNFSYSLNGKTNEDILTNTLQELLIESVEIRLYSQKNTALSLSAGYDARGIAGILFKYTKAAKIDCFSYTGNKPDIKSRDDSDDLLSQKIASFCGYKHQTIRNYNGDLLSHLQHNAAEGKCLANWCDELDTWRELSQEHAFSDIFVGDECFGDKYIPLLTKDDILTSININGAHSICGLKRSIKRDLYKKLYNSVTDLNKKIFERANAQQIFQDKKDFLYLDQRINHVLTPWRDIIAHVINGVVHNPYLDEKILDFMMTVPPELRKSKLLFRNTITKMLPDLFAIPIAKSVAKTNWKNEIIKNKDLLIQLVNTTTSPLDGFFSKNEIIKLINSVDSNREKFRYVLFKTITHLKKKNNVLGKIAQNLFSKDFSYVGLEKIIIRILTIRIYLSNIQSDGTQVKPLTPAAVA